MGTITIETAMIASLTKETHMNDEKLQQNEKKLQILLLLLLFFKVVDSVISPITNILIKVVDW